MSPDIRLSTRGECLPSSVISQTTSSPTITAARPAEIATTQTTPSQSPTQLSDSVISVIAPESPVANTGPSVPAAVVGTWAGSVTDGSSVIQVQMTIADTPDAAGNLGVLRETGIGYSGQFDCSHPLKAGDPPIAGVTAFIALAASDCTSVEVLVEPDSGGLAVLARSLDGAPLAASETPFQRVAG